MQGQAFLAKLRLAPGGIIVPLALTVALPLALLILPSRAVAQAQSSTPPLVSAQANPQLFATMCALYAAGFEADVSSDTANPAIDRTTFCVVGSERPGAQALRKYYRDHELSDPAQTCPVTLPSAWWPGRRRSSSYTLAHEDLPPDVLALEGFNQVLANFYQEARSTRLWNQVEAWLRAGRSALSRTAFRSLVLKETGYLREILRPGRRTFTVYVEPLVGARTNVRNIGNQYVVVVDPQLDSIDRIRHAFLHFVIDPLPIRYADSVAAESPLLSQAERAPRLPAEFHDDVSGFSPSAWCAPWNCVCSGCRPATR